MMLIVTSSPLGIVCRTAVFLARMVMPFSRSRSIESITRVATSWPLRNAPDCHSIASTRVVFPWSTCATMATLRRSERVGMPESLPSMDGGCRRPGNQDSLPVPGQPPDHAILPGRPERSRSQAVDAAGDGH